MKKLNGDFDNQSTFGVQFPKALHAHRSTTPYHFFEWRYI